MTRFVSGGLVAVTLAGGLAAAAPAEARDRLSPGGAAALGVIGGLALGAGIAAAATPTYAAPAPVYRAPPPPVVVEERPVYYAPPARRVYYAPPPRRVVVEERCWVERTRHWVPGWGWEHERRTVCE
jgi:hypothetical protein